MGFINNHKDNFLPSGNPWGDDNVTVYNFPREGTFDVSSMDFEQLKETFDDMEGTYGSLPPCPAKNQLKNKMMAISRELKKRNSIEEMARIDRDDNFEIPQRIIKEDVITPSPPIREVLDNIVEPTVPVDETDEMLEDMLDEVEEMDLQESVSTPQRASVGGMQGKEFDNFLIAALVIITLIAVTK